MAASSRAWRFPDARGEKANVVLGFASLRGYLEATDVYFGGLVGRFANQIAGGRFSLDGKSYAVDVNAGGNCLHGGRSGFDKRLWRVEPLSDSELSLTLTSADGDQGFPGRLNVEVTTTCWKAASARRGRRRVRHPAGPTPREAIGARLRDPHPQLLAARGYDHNYVLRGSGLRRAARLADPLTGRVLEVLTDQPSRRRAAAQQACDLR